MKKLRWAVDSGYWDLDVTTPVTVEGTARAVPATPLPLGLSRGITLSRAKQLDFMHTFLSLPFAPSYAGDPLKNGDGFSLQRAASLSLGEKWVAILVAQLNLQKLVSSIRKVTSNILKERSWYEDIRACLCDRSLYAFGLCSEFFAAPNFCLLLNTETCSGKRGMRNKAVLSHKLAEHNLTIEATLPALYVDNVGTYWDVPFSSSIDLASVSSSPGWSYHLCMKHISGIPVQFPESHPSLTPPETLQPSSCIQSAFSLRKDADIWRRKEGKLRKVQPFDIFLSHPRVSVSGMIGAVIQAFCRDDSHKSLTDGKDTQLGVYGGGFSLSGDSFGSVSCTAQYGNFQRLFFDLTRLSAQLDIPSGSALMRGIAFLARDVYSSHQLKLEALDSICPNIALSFQQQIAGPISFRVDSRVSLKTDGAGKTAARVDESVFALEYALKVLGSAKAVAWYSPKHQEAMVELRFFER